MKPFIYSTLSFALAVGLLSGCGGNDAGPIITPNGPTASAEDQRMLESDALTSEEATLVSQANSEPDPTLLPDL